MLPETNDEIKQISLGELRKTNFTHAIAEALMKYCIVIFLGSDNLRGGSGTLVIYKGIKGILTASHVAALLENSLFAIPYRLREGCSDIWEIQQIPIKRILTIDDLSLYQTPELIENWSENGLDITLLQLDDEVFEDILKSTGKNSLDLEQMKDKYEAEESKYWSPFNKNDWSWTICGTPRKSLSLIENDVVYFPYASTYIGGGSTKLRLDTLQKIKEPYSGLDVDIIETELGPTEDEIPDDFSGASGGPIFQTRERLTGNTISNEEIMLAGIFVAGDEKVAKKLWSRGHIALYDIFCIFLDKIVNENSTDFNHD